MPSPNLRTLIHRKDTPSLTRPLNLTLCGLPLEVRDAATGEILLERKTSRGVITCPRCAGVNQ